MTYVNTNVYSRLAFQNPKTLFDRCIFYLPVKKAFYDDYCEVNPVWKNGKWDYPGGLKEIPRIRVLHFDVLGKIVKVETSIYPQDFTSDYIKKVGEYVYVSLHIDSDGFVYPSLPTAWDWLEYELKVQGNIVGRVDKIEEMRTGRFGESIKTVMNGEFCSRYTGAYFPFELNVPNNQSDI